MFTLPFSWWHDPEDCHHLIATILFIIGGSQGRVGHHRHPTPDRNQSFQDASAWETEGLVLKV